MRIMKLRYLLLATLLVPAPALSSDMDPRYRSIGDLGALNGTALQCKYLDQTRRMKQAIIATAPKERSFGLAFDQETHRSFLEFSAHGRSCPSPAEFEQTVGERIQSMQRAFAAHAGKAQGR